MKHQDDDLREALSAADSERPPSTPKGYEFQKQLLRVEMMSEVKGEDWNLSEPDRAALRAVLFDRARLVEECERLRALEFYKTRKRA